MAISVTAHHVAFSVTDLERSRKFYEQVLGLQSISRPNLGTLKGVWYGAGAGEVHLSETPDGVDVGNPPPNLNPVAGHAAFAVDDYDETLAHIEAHGCKVLQNRTSGQMWLADPDGHVIELIVPGPVVELTAAPGPRD